MVEWEDNVLKEIFTKRIGFKDEGLRCRKGNDKENGYGSDCISDSGDSFVERCD